MQKKIIALAVVAAFSAPAFADTALYGIVDAGLANVSNSGQKSQTLIVSGGLSTSRIGVKGTEDLGNGLSAVYNLEYALDIASNTGIGAANIGSGTLARQQMVGLTGDFGTAVAGRLQTTAKDFGDKYDPTSGSDVSSLNNLTSARQFLIGSTAQAARASRAIAYISPNINGLKVAVNYVTVLAAGLGNLTVLNTAADTNKTVTLISANYEAGPLSVGGVYGSDSAPATATTAASLDNRKEYALGASYDFGMAKVFGTYQGSHNDATGAAGNTDKVYSLNGLIPAGPGAVVVGYASSKVSTDSTGNSDSKSYDMAYLYNLSKTATIYGAYAHVSNNSAGATSVLNNAIAAGQASGATSSVVAIGLKKSF
jgi:predicted porin